MPYRVRNAKDDTANRWVSKHLSDDLGLDEGWKGALAGGLAGAGLGSVVPGLGTLAGGIAGAYAGHKIGDQGISDPTPDKASAAPGAAKPQRNAPIKITAADRLAMPSGPRKASFQKPVAEGSCNMTMEGSYCPEHGLAECGSMYEDGGAVGMPYSMGEGEKPHPKELEMDALVRSMQIQQRADGAEKRLAQRAAEPRTLGQKIKKDIGDPLMKLAKGDIRGAMGEDNDILSMHNKMKEGTVGQLAGGTLGALGGATVGTALGGPIGGAIGTAFGGTAGQMGGDKLGDKIGAVVGEESPTAAVVKGAAKAATQGLGDVVGGGGKDILKNLLAIESDDPINSNSAMTGSYYEGKETDIQEGDALLARIKSLALLR
jgi:hypothetical protein